MGCSPYWDLSKFMSKRAVPLLYAGTPAVQWKRLSVEQLRNDIVRNQLATESEIEAYFGLLDAPDFVSQGFIVMTAWGRRPDA